ncbi:MAG: hypothetical protein WAL22_18160 [Solirubrobacteraceae bacterium]
MGDSSTQGIKTVLHPVTELEKPVYAAPLGIAPEADSADYVGLEAVQLSRLELP